MAKKRLPCLFIILASIFLAQGQDGEKSVLKPVAKSDPDHPTICYFNEEGRFCATRLGLAAPYYVSRTRLDYPGDIIISPNERYVTYHGCTTGSRRQALVLYDVGKRTERTLHFSPPYTSEEAEFSPDSKSVALLIAGHQHLLPPEQEGVYLYEIAGTGKKFIQYPRESWLSQAKVMGATVKWSEDGRWLYIRFNTSDQGQGDICEEYLRLDPQKRTYKHVTGNYNGRTASDLSFWEGGTTVILHENQHAKGGSFCTDLISHNGRYRATVDKSLHLLINGPGFGPETIEVADWQSGDGDICPIKPMAWINNRYLIYSVHEDNRFYDVSTKHVFPLFNEKVTTFTWLDGNKDGGIIPEKTDPNAHPGFISFSVHPKLRWNPFQTR